ncbi:ABC transporter substrate-binding protein [Okibacterium endophyticum]
MRFIKAGVAVAAATVLLLSGCAAGGNGGTNGGEAPKDLVLGNLLAPATLDAGNMNWGNQSIYGQAVYDTLLRSDPNGVDALPGLATEWAYNEDSTVLTLTLRDDVTFTDGVAFNADVAAQNLLRFRDGTSPQRAKASNVVDARAVDDTTLEIELGRSDPYFYLYLAQAPGLVASPNLFDNADAATNPIGSGPYILNTDDSVVGTSYKFDKNPEYWDPDIQYYDSITVNVYADNTSMLNALRGKQLNGSALIDNSTLQQVEEAGYTVNPLFLSMVGLFLWDRGGVLNPAIGDVRVRQAINHAIDAEAFLETFGLGYGELTQQTARPSSVAYDESLNSTYDYDPEKARELLSEAGYGDGFELVMPSSPAQPQALLALIQQQLSEVGITATFQDVGQNFLPDMLAGKYAASYFQLGQDPLPSQFINFVVAPNATWNPLKYEDPEVNELIDRVRAGGEDGDTAAKELNAYLVEEAWFNPWYTVQTSFVTDDVTSVTINQGNAYPSIQDIRPAS